MPREFEWAAVHVVAAGDTLGGIAAAHGVSLAELTAANVGLIEDPDFIQIGWELTIPGALAAASTATAPAGIAEPETHTVVAGDTLSALAERWSTPVATIAELNGIVNPDAIALGQRIRRPGRDAAPSTTGAVPSEPAPATEPGRLEFVRWPLDLPPARVTGGYREDYGGYLHRGIDIGGAPVGTPIIAPASGIVTVHRPGDGWGSGSFGICVVLDHPGTPWWSIYAHMNGTERRNGDEVAAGDVIGTVGFTGRVVPPGPAGAHLHWQLSAHADFPIDFAFIANPLDFLRA